MNSEQYRMAETCGLAPKMPWWAKRLGATYWNNDGSVRTRIGEISYRYRGLAFDLGSYGNPHLHFGLIFFAIFIPLPSAFERWLGRGAFGERPRYGFSWRWNDGDGSALHLHWGQKTKVVWMPWEGEHIRTEYLGVDLAWHDDRTKPGSYHAVLQGAGGLTFGPEPWSEQYPYRYMLDDGEVQNVTATVTRRRAFHGRRWIGPKQFRAWLRSFLPKRLYDSIDIQFDQEVGSRRGSWKGGCVGCSYSIRPDESPRAALMRMQRERRFR